MEISKGLEFLDGSVFTVTPNNLPFQGLIQGNHLKQP